MRTSTPRGVAQHQTLRQRLTEPLPESRPMGLADEDVGDPALADHLSGRVDDVVVLLDQHRRPEHGRQLPECTELFFLAVAHPLLGALDPEQVKVGAEALGRAPRAPHQTLGASPARTSARIRSPTAFGTASSTRSSRVDRGCGGLDDEALRLDFLGDLAKRHLAQCREVLQAEEVVERRLDVLSRVDLARREAARSGPRA